MVLFLFKHIEREKNRPVKNSPTYAHWGLKVQKMISLYPVCIMIENFLSSCYSKHHNRHLMGVYPTTKKYNRRLLLQAERSFDDISAIKQQLLSTYFLL